MEHWKRNVRILAAILVALLLLAGAEGLAAQAGSDTGTVTLPAAVVSKLLQIESLEDLSIGALPEDLSARLPLPAELEVVAVLSLGRELSVWQVLLSTAEPWERVRPRLVETLTGAGWVETSIRGPLGGFDMWGGEHRRSMREARAAASLELCNPDGWSLDGGVDASETGSHLRLLVRAAGPSGRGPACTSSSAQAAPVTDEPRGGDLVELPDLHDPEGAVNVAGGGGGRSSDSADSHLSLSTALPAADIDRAYGEQLLEAGWTWLPQAGSEDWALSLVQKEAGADGGEPLHGTLYTFCSELAAPVDGRFVPPGVEPGSRVCRVQIAVLAAP